MVKCSKRLRERTSGRGKNRTCPQLAPAVPSRSFKLHRITEESADSDVTKSMLTAICKFNFPCTQLLQNMKIWICLQVQKTNSFWRWEAQNLDQEKYTSACDTHSREACGRQAVPAFARTVGQNHRELLVVRASQQHPALGLWPGHAAQEFTDSPVVWSASSVRHTARSRDPPNLKNLLTQPSHQLSPGNSGSHLELYQFVPWQSHKRQNGNSTREECTSSSTGKAEESKYSSQIHSTCQQPSLSPLPVYRATL